MKNPVSSLFALLLTGLAITACQKEPTPLEDQVVGHWLSTSVKADSTTDLTKFYSYDLVLQASLTFSMTLDYKNTQSGNTITSVTAGTWTSDDDTQKLTLVNSDTKKMADYVVKSIDNAFMTLETTLNNKKTLITFRKK